MLLMCHENLINITSMAIVAWNLFKTLSLKNNYDYSWQIWNVLLWNWGFSFQCCAADYKGGTQMRIKTHNTTVATVRIVKVVWSNVHLHTQVWSVCVMLPACGKCQAAADSCHLSCQDPTISSQAFISLSLTHTHYSLLYLLCSSSLQLFLTW